MRAMPRGIGTLISLSHFYSYNSLGSLSSFNLAISLVQVLKYAQKCCSKEKIWESLTFNFASATVVSLRSCLLRCWKDNVMGGLDLKWYCSCPSFVDIIIVLQLIEILAIKFRSVKDIDYRITCLLFCESILVINIDVAMYTCFGCVFHCYSTKEKTVKNCVTTRLLGAVA